MKEMNIRVIVEQFPEDIRAFISRQQGYYILGVNDMLTAEEKAAAAAHELYHIFSGDLDRKNVDEIEQNAPRMPQNPF